MSKPMEASCPNFKYVFQESLWDYFSVILVLGTVVNFSLFAIVGNTLVGYLIYSTRQLWTKKHVLVINLIFIDLLTATVSIPCYTFFLLSFALGNPWCPFRDIHLIISGVCFSMTVINLSLIGYERFFAVIFPYRHHAYLTVRRMAFLVALSWIYGLFLTVPVFGRVATVSHDWEVVSLVSNAIHLVHIATTVACYATIRHVASWHQKSISKGSKHIRKISKSSRTFLYIVGMLLLCTLPTCILPFVNQASVQVEYFVSGSSFVSSATNLLIYSLRSEDIQAVIERKVFKRANASVHPTQGREGKLDESSPKCQTDQKRTSVSTE